MIDIITCEKGWESIYLPVVKSILTHDKECDSISKKIGVKAVKSENGMLRILLYNPVNAPREIRLNIINAATKSLNVCEMCGSTDDIGYSYGKIMRTCCHNCHKTKFKEEDSKSKWYKRNKK